MDHREKLGRAALDLRKHLFGPATNSLEQPGFVAIGPTGIIVFLHCRKRDWRGESPQTWQGYRVAYRYGVGPAMAQFDRRIV